MALQLRENTDKNIFAVGEYWAPGEVNLLQDYIEATEGCMSLFDSSLQQNFHIASKEGADYDLRKIFDETKKNQKGYFWEILALYFIEMKNRNLIEPFSNIVFLSANNGEATEYSNLNPDKIEAFYLWSKNYDWK